MLCCWMIEKHYIIKGPERAERKGDEMSTKTNIKKMVFAKEAENAKREAVRTKQAAKIAALIEKHGEQWLVGDLFEKIGIKAQAYVMDAGLAKEQGLPGAEQDFPGGWCVRVNDTLGYTRSVVPVTGDAIAATGAVDGGLY